MLEVKKFDEKETFNTFYNNLLSFEDKIGLKPSEELVGEKKDVIFRCGCGKSKEGYANANIYM